MSLLDRIGAKRFRNRTQQIMAAQPLFAWLGACVVAVGEATCEIELQLSTLERKYADVSCSNGVLASVTIGNQEQDMPVQEYVIELMGQST